MLLFSLVVYLQQLYVKDQVPIRQRMVGIQGDGVAYHRQDGEACL